MNAARLFSAVVLAAVAVVAPAVGAAAQDPIAPDQFFSAQVYGANGGSYMMTFCSGPGNIGHPVSGQTVQVLLVPPPGSTTLGYTGSAANSINAVFSAPAPFVNPPVVLTAYSVRVPIPTTLTVPCFGTGVVDFVPTPTSPTARTYTVTVSYSPFAV